MFYRGYVKLRADKSSAMPFKNKKSSELLSLDQARAQNHYAGVLAEDAILIDVDDMEQSEKLLTIIEDKNVRCRVLQSRKGMHFLFLNHAVDKCGNAMRLACGITADIKVGKRNSLEVLKIDGQERELLYDILDDEEYQEIPKWLYPVKTTVDFSTLGEGDGRNEELYKYILSLTAAGLTKDESREAIRIINDYVLPDKLPEDEIDKILRDDAFAEESFRSPKGRLLHDKFAKYLIAEHHIVKINERVHIYLDGVYVTGDKKIEHAMLKHIPTLRSAERKEVLAYIDAHIATEWRQSPANYIVFKNGVYDVLTDKLVPHTPDIVSTNMIPWDYAPGAYHEVADKVLNKVSDYDPDIRRLLEEAIGYCFYRRNEMRKAFVLTGEKRNGKSTYLDLIAMVLGEENIASLDMAELSEKFKAAEIFGKMANIGDDIDDDYIRNTAILKKVISGDKITVEEKGIAPYKFNPYAKFLFSANTIPKVKDRSGALLDRLIILPFRHQFSKKDPDYDPYIKYKLRCRECAEYLIQVGIAGLKRVLDNQEFSHSDAAQEEWDEYNLSNNPILNFFAQMEKEDLLNEPITKGYRQYTKYCVYANMTPISLRSFSGEVKKKYGIKTKRKKINGKLYTIFVKNESESIT